MITHLQNNLETRGVISLERFRFLELTKRRVENYAKTLVEPGHFVACLSVCFVVAVVVNKKIRVLEST